MRRSHHKRNKKTLSGALFRSTVTRDVLLAQGSKPSQAVDIIIAYVQPRWQQAKLARAHQRRIAVDEMAGDSLNLDRLYLPRSSVKPNSVMITNCVSSEAVIAKLLALVGQGRMQTTGDIDGDLMAE